MRCIEDTRRVEGQLSGNFSRHRAIGWGRELLSGFGPRSCVKNITKLWRTKGSYIPNSSTPIRFQGEEGLAVRLSAGYTKGMFQLD